MPVGFRFTPDDQGIYEVANGAGVRGILTERAQVAAKEVRRLSPKKRHFFSYTKSVKAVPAKKVGKGYESAVEVDSPGWHLVEYGSRYSTATAPLRRGVRNSGLRFEEN